MEKRGHGFVLVVLLTVLLIEVRSQSRLCRRRCGDLAIEYPFGIDDGCGSLEYRSLFVCTDNAHLELRTPTGRYPVRNISYESESESDPHVIISDPSMWRCSAGDTLPHSHRFSIDMSKKFSISNSNNFLYFNCNRSSVLVQPPFGNCDSCSMCDTTHYLCTHLPDCPKPLPHASCCSYYPRTSDSFRLMLENCESYASIYWDAYNQNPGYGIRLNYEIPITSECQNCQREVDGTCGYHTQFATFLCLCTHNNVTTHCTEYSHLHHLSQGRVLAGIISSIIIGGMIFTGVIIWYLRRTRANRPLRLGVVNNNT